MCSHSEANPFYDSFADDFIEEDEDYWEMADALAAEAVGWDYPSDGGAPEIEETYEIDINTEPGEFTWFSDYLILAVFIVILCSAGLVRSINGNMLSPANAEQPAAVNFGGRPFPYQVNDPTTVIAPYKEYNLTQGLHGQSYGHLAIDLAAGRGEPVLSPINGIVTDYYIDEYNNTTLVIENDAFQVTLLHGDFNVSQGDELQIGQVIGTEGNNGYTKDYWGNLCYGRVHCGNHTHLNIFDKRLNANVNPLDLIQ